MLIGTLSCHCLQLLHIPGTLSQPSSCDFIPSTTSTKDASQYWLFAGEYSIWNATGAALQFWTEDLKPHVFNHAIDQVYTAFLYSDHTQQIHNLTKEILFSHFMTTLNDAFEIEFAQEDKWL